LHCPACDYNLTGLNDLRCPECGQSFDPQQLRWSIANRSEVPGWDDGRLILPVAFARTCLLIWFRPVHFARSFPPACRPESTRQFQTIVMILTAGALPVWLSTWVSDLVHGLRMWVSLVPILLWGAAASESILRYVWESDTWQWQLREGSRRARPETSSGLIGYHRSFVLLGVVLLAGAGLLERVTWLVPGAPAILLLMLLWWLMSITLSLGALASLRPARAFKMPFFFIAGLISNFVLLVILWFALAVCFAITGLALLFVRA
jgi:hypothetical protein